MNPETYTGDPENLPRIELISRYINGYYRLGSALRARYEAAFRKRNLPLPRMGAQPPPARRESPWASMDVSTFLDYLLLIYSGSAIFYSWIFLAKHLFRMDFARSRHTLVQTALALFYIFGELALAEYFAGQN